MNSASPSSAALVRDLVQRVQGMKVVIAMEGRQEKTLPADKHSVLLVSPISHCNLLRAPALASC